MRGTRFWAHFLVYVKNVIHLKITEIFNFRLKRKNYPRILFLLSSRPLNDEFFCSKKLKIRELDGLLKFSKIPPSPGNFEN